MFFLYFFLSYLLKFYLSCINFRKMKDEDEFLVFFLKFCWVEFYSCVIGFGDILYMLFFWWYDVMLCDNCIFVMLFWDMELFDEILFCMLW